MFSGLLCVLLAAAPVFGQGLESRIRDAGRRGPVVWVSYRVPAVPRRDSTWCCCEHQTRISLEGSSELVVLARVENGAVVKLRTASPDCEIDAGGLPLVPLTGVTPDESVTWLASLIAGSASSARSEPVARGAMSALAGHAAQSAVAPLIDAARNNPNRKLRGQALFWLAQRAGSEATATIVGAIANDPDTEVKKKAVFALSQLPKDDGVPKLIDVARNNRNAEVRKQAMFWLGESHDPRAVAFFEEILLRK